MPGAREIKEHISSIEDTRKITSAMYLISSTKLRRARKNLDETEPFFYSMRAMISKVLRHVPELEHRYFGQEEDKSFSQRGQGYVVITADKGLAGAYNHNVLKLVEEQLAGNENYHLFVIGEAGRQYFAGKGIPVDEHFQYTAQNPNLDRARTITDRVLAAYNAHEIDEVYVVYTCMVNSMEVQTQMERLLPLYRSDFSSGYRVMPMNVIREEFLFEPSADKVLDSCVPVYIAGFIYGAMVESFCSEQNARMVAMQAANDSSAKMLHDLNIRYNRVRQAQITQQITEVAGGAKAQKRVKK